MGREDVRALGEEVGRRVVARARAAGPVLEAGLDELDADQEHGGTGDDGREDLEHDLGRYEGDEDFEEGAACGGADDGAVALRARKLVPFVVCGAEPVGVHLRQSSLCDGEDGERSSDDGNQTGADIVSLVRSEVVPMRATFICVCIFRSDT